MDSVRIGVVGIGGMGSHHAGYLVKGEVPRAKLTAVCDVNPARLEWAAGNLPEDVRRFDNSDELIASGCVDAVLIATPHYFHPPIAISAFQHGLHVLSEKPAGVYTRQVREMNEAAEASGLVFALMFNQRTLETHQRLRDLVQSGEVGEILRTHYMITNWFRSQAYYDSGGWRATWAGEGGGVLINQCPHNLDLWQWICGMPCRVRAFCGFGKYHNIEVEDDVTAYVEYPNGATGTFITTTGEAPGRNILEITGDRGRLVLEHGKIVFERTRVSVAEFRATSPNAFGTPETWRCEIPAGGGGSHAIITRNFVEAILDGKPLMAPGTEGIRSLEISNAMHLSAWTDDWVTIPVDEQAYLDALNERIANSQVRKGEGTGAVSVAGSFNM